MHLIELVIDYIDETVLRIYHDGEINITTGCGSRTTVTENSKCRNYRDSYTIENLDLLAFVYSKTK